MAGRDVPRNCLNIIHCHWACGIVSRGKGGRRRRRRRRRGRGCC